MNEQLIEKAVKEVGKLDLADHILAWDKKQAPEVYDAATSRMVPNPTARYCGLNKKHGTLAIHANGNALMCCITRPSVCEYSEPVSR